MATIIYSEDTSVPSARSLGALIAACELLAEKANPRSASSSAARVIEAGGWMTNTRFRLLEQELRQNQRKTTAVPAARRINEVIARELPRARHMRGKLTPEQEAQFHLSTSKQRLALQ